MQQQDVIKSQLAQEIVDIIEPVIPYLVIGSKKADEKARKKAGPDAWTVKKKMWEKLCLKEHPELKEAAGDMIIAPSDPEVKQVFVQEILKSFEMDTCLEKEISAFIEAKAIKKLNAEESSDKLTLQGSCDRTRVIEEFNELREKLTAKNNDVGVTRSGNEIGAGSTDRDLKPPGTGQRKQEILEKALDFACQIQYGDLRSQALSLIVPYLEGQKKEEYIKKVLYSASNIHDDAERAKVFAPISPYLAGSGKEDLIEEIFDFSPHIQYDDAKFEILSVIAPHMDSTMNESLLEKALEMVSGIQSEFLRVQAFSMLIPCLKGQRKEEIIDEALQLASNLKDKDVRPQALLSVIPHLEEARKKEILKKALEIACGIQSESRKEKALSSLVPYLESPKREEIVEKILSSGSIAK